MLVDFITEIVSTGDESRDFKLYMKALDVLRHSTLSFSATNNGRFHGVHFHQNDKSEPCNVPFFGYNIGNQYVSPILPEVETPDGVTRWFSGYGSLITDERNIANILGTYHLPMKRITLNGNEFIVTATVTICGVACREHPLKHVLTKLDPVVPSVKC